MKTLLRFAPLLTLLLAACSEPNSPVGGGIGSGLEGTVVVGSFYADSAVSYTSTPIHTGGSANIYVGAAYGVTATGLVRFHRPFLPTNYALDTTRTTRIQLAYQGGIKPTWSTTVLPFLIDLKWTEADSIDPASLPIGDQMTVLSPVSEGPDSGLFSLAVSPTWIWNWMAVIDSNLTDTIWAPDRSDSGLTIKLVGAPLAVGLEESLVRFRSRTAVEDSSSELQKHLKPRLYIPVTITDTLGNKTADSMEVFAAGDMFLVQYNTQSTKDTLFVGSGVPWRSLLRFNLDSLWAEKDSADIVVNRATLTLYREPVAEPWPTSMAVWPFKLTSDAWLANPTQALLESFSVILTPIDTTRDSVQMVVTNPAALWAKGTAENHGIAIASGAVGNDLDRVAFHSAGDPNPALRPRLTVYYTRLAK